MEMNLENLAQLRDWLKYGALDVKFDMRTGLRLVKLDPEAETACGTVCCIGGAAHWMSQGMPTPTEMITLNRDNLVDGLFHKDMVSWEHLAPEALRWLGLPDNGGFMKHDLFDPDLAPYKCTPRQAARAVQNVMNGLEPWE